MMMPYGRPPDNAVLYGNPDRPVSTTYTQLIPLPPISTVSERLQITSGADTPDQQHHQLRYGFMHGGDGNSDAATCVVDASGGPGNGVMYAASDSRSPSSYLYASPHQQQQQQQQQIALRRPDDEYGQISDQAETISSSSTSSSAAIAVSLNVDVARRLNGYQSVASISQQTSQQQQYHFDCQPQQLTVRTASGFGQVDPDDVPYGAVPTDAGSSPHHLINLNQQQQLHPSPMPSSPPTSSFDILQAQHSNCLMQIKRGANCNILMTDAVESAHPRIHQGIQLQPTTSSPPRRPLAFQQQRIGSPQTPSSSTDVSAGQAQQHAGQSSPSLTAMSAGSAGELGGTTTAGGGGDEISTRDVAQRISNELKRYSIPQAVFAQRVLGRSQGTLSDLLRNPKPWSKLKSGRETFRRMWKWLQEPEYQRMAALRSSM